MWKLTGRDEVNMTHSPKWPMILSFIKMRKQIFEEGEFTFLHFELVVPWYIT